MFAQCDPSIARLLEMAIDGAPIGFLLVNASGTVRLVNSELERIFGYARDELVGQSVEILVPRNDHDTHLAFFRNYVADPSSRAMAIDRELAGRRKDGSEVPVEIGFNPIRNDEGFCIFVSIVDISHRRQLEHERHQLEEQLFHSQKLETLGALAGGIAHDFNNVLSAIIGFAELAAATAKEPTTQSDLKEVLGAAERGRELVRRILGFARRQEIELKPVDLGRVVGEAIRMIGPTLSRSIDLRVRLPAAPLRAVADATAVQQVVMNLLTNAVQAMPNGGVLEVGLETTEVGDAVARNHPNLREGDHALLTVRDSGSGIAPDLLPRVFEPFFTTKPPGQGTGLGLATVRSILAKHHGAIELASTPGAGTVARCWFPLLESVARTPAGGP
jgi:PAS domain S-box-containing protein